MRRHVLVMIALTGLALGGGWFVLRGPGGAGGGATEAARDVRGGREGPVLHGRGAGATRDVSLASEQVEVHVTRDGAPVAADVNLVLRGRAIGAPRSWEMPWRDRTAAPGSDRAQLVAEARAGPDGRATFQPPGPGLYAAIAWTDDGARGRALVRVTEGGGTKPTRVEVQGGGSQSLTGRVRTSEGTPWQGFVDAVGHDPDQLSPDLLRPHPTDEEGRFTVGGLRAGAAWIVVWTPGAMRWDSRRITIPYAGELVLTLPPQPPEVACRVLDARTRAPIAGALVARLDFRLGEFVRARAEAVTDARGMCRLAGWPTHAEAPGYEPFTADGAPDTREAVLLLRPLHGVRGRVVERGSRAPAAGAIVVGCPPPHDGNGYVAAAVADAEGRFRLEGLRSGPTWVFVVGGGWCSPDVVGALAAQRPAWYVAVGENDALELEREVVRSGRVEGRVLDPAGAPVSGVLVTTTGIGDVRPSDLASHAATALRDLTPWSRTGDDGRYALELRVPDVGHVLSASGPLHVPVKVTGVRAPSGAVVTRDLVLESGRRLTVRVREAGTGAPVVGAVVSATCAEDATHPPWGRSGTTDTKGVVRLLGLPPSAPQVSAWAEGWQRSEELRLQEPGDLEVTLELRRLVPLATGTVRFEDGSPLTDVRLSIREWGTASLDDTSGRFEVEGLAVEELTLVFEHGDLQEPIHVQRTRTGTPPLDVVLPTPKRRAITLRVLDAVGRPVRAFSAAWMDEFDCTAWRAGTSELRIGPFDGRVWVLISGARDAAGEPLDVAPTALGPYEGDGRVHEVRLLPGRAVAGHVVDADGRPLPALKVKATSLLVPQPAELVQDGWDPPDVATVTDRHGRFRVTGLGEGPVELWVVPPPGLGHANVIVEAGATDVALVLHPLGTLEVRVLDERGAPLEGATVSRGGGKHAVTDRAGVARLVDANVSVEQSLDVRPPPLRTDLGTLEGVAWRAGGPPLVLPRTVRISGRVVDERGAPVADATVHVVDDDEDGHETGVGCDQEGRFELAGLRPGRIQAWAGTDEPRRTSERLVLADGATDVRLVVATGATLAVRLIGPGGTTVETSVTLTSRDGAPSEREASTDEQGVARFTGLRPGDRYELHARAEDDEDAPWLAFAAGVRGDAGEVTLTLAQPITLGGFVQGPPPGTTVLVSVRQGSVREETYTRSDGGFLLKDLPAGTWTVHAKSVGAARRWAGSTIAAAGSRITLTLAPE